MRTKGTILENCPFCGRQAIAKNPQGVAVCTSHREKYLELRCVCGSWLEVMNGKYGVYCNCLKCGNIPLKKALDFNEVMKPMPTDTAKPQPNAANNTPAKTVQTNTTIRSDDPDYFSD